MVSKTASLLSGQAGESLRALGSNFRVARQRRRLTQADLALKAGVSRSSIKRIEAGDPGISLSVLANALVPMGLEHSLAGLLNPDLDAEGISLEQSQRPKRIRHGEVNLDTDF